MANKRQRLARKKFKSVHPPSEEAKPADASETTPTNKKLKLERWKKRMEKQRLREERLAAKKKQERPAGKCWVCNGEGHRSSDCPINNRHMICLGCRGRGHTLRTCPQAAGAQSEVGGGPKPATKMCYNCGEEGHNLSGCKKPIKDGGTQFATCFVCKEKGHISAACPRNEHGIYPKGGSCKHCNSVRHLAKDCPEKAPKSTVYGKMPAPPAVGLSAKKTVFASGDDLEDDFTVPEGPAKEINWGTEDVKREEDMGAEAMDSDQEEELDIEVLGESKNVTRKRHSVGAGSKKRKQTVGDDLEKVVPQSAPPKVSRKKIKMIAF